MRLFKPGAAQATIVARHHRRTNGNPANIGYRVGMILRHLALLVLFLACNPLRVAAQPAKDEQPVAPYYPGASWQHKIPSEVGINPKLLKEAVDLAIAGETRAPRDLVLSHYETFG